MTSVMAAALDESPPLEMLMHCVHWSPRPLLHHLLCEVLGMGGSRVQGSVQGKISNDFGHLDLSSSVNKCVVIKTISESYKFVFNF